MNYQDLVTRLSQINLNITEAQIALFKQYFTLIESWNEKINLTALKTEEDMIEKHFFDSLLLAHVLPLTNQSLLDVGSGAGFPGIPLKIVFPELQITLLEPTHKRATFLQLVIDELNLKGIQVVADRAELFVLKKRESFDIVTARAVASLNILAELCLPLVKVHGHFIAMKGAKGVEEISSASVALQLLSGVVKHVDEQHLITEADKRYNILIEKIKKTSPQYPRSYAQIKHRPL